MIFLTQAIGQKGFLVKNQRTGRIYLTGHVSLNETELAESKLNTGNKKRRVKVSQKPESNSVVLEEETYEAENDSVQNSNSTSQETLNTGESVERRYNLRSHVVPTESY